VGEDQLDPFQRRRYDAFEEVEVPAMKMLEAFLLSTLMAVAGPGMDEESPRADHEELTKEY